MKKRIIMLAVWLCIIAFFAMLLNISVTTKRGVNYKVQTLRIPLFVKGLGFLDRHYNYKLLVNEIIEKRVKTDEKVLEIFEWTYKNIRRTPPGLPIVDDHVWYTIVRGYGEDDQFSDVFTTLCNYAGVDAFYNLIKSNTSERRMPLSFVKIENRWIVFDPYNGVYFRNKHGELADINDIKNGEFNAVSIDSTGRSKAGYSDFIADLPEIYKLGLTKASIQSPFKRFIFWIKNRS